MEPTFIVLFCLVGSVFTCASVKYCYTVIMKRRRVYMIDYTIITNHFFRSNKITDKTFIDEEIKEEPSHQLEIRHSEIV